MGTPPQQLREDDVTGRTHEITDLLHDQLVTQQHLLEQMGSLVADGIRAGQAGRQISYPADASRFTFPPAPDSNNRIQFDLIEGKVTIPGLDTKKLNFTLKDLGAEQAFSGNFWADDDVKIFTFNKDGFNTGIFEYDQCTYMPIQATPFTRFEFESGRSFNTRIQISSGTLAPILPLPTSSHQRRRGRIATDSGSLQTMPWVASSIKDLGFTSLQTAVDKFGKGTIHLPNIGQQVFMLENKSGQDAEVQLRMKSIGGESWFADPDIHGNPDLSNTATVSANDKSILESGMSAHIKQLRVQSASSGTETIIQAQYEGFAPGMR